MSIRPRASFVAVLLALFGWVCIMLLCEISGGFHAFGPIKRYTFVDICFWAILLFLSAASVIEFMRMKRNYYKICEDGIHVIRKKGGAFYPRQQISVVCQKWACYKLLYVIAIAHSGNTIILKITYTKRIVRAISDLGYSVLKDF